MTYSLDDRKKPGQPDSTTSFHLLRARSGSQESTGWLVERFTPVLMVHAAYRLGPRLRTRCDPADVVADVWTVALPRLETLKSKEGHEVASLLRFLSTTLIYRINNLARKVIRMRGELPDAEAPQPVLGQARTERLPAETSGVITRVTRRERSNHFARALENLDDVSRKIVHMRGIEQLPNAVVARRLKMPPGTVSHRYNESLKRLRVLLPNSIFDDLSS